MQTLRHRHERGKTHIDWLDSYHTFSFGEYHDPQFMGFGDLRVINDDYIKPGGGFSTHGHRDMEIVTYVLEGALRHEDSLGNGSIIKAGDVQRMTAGTGVRHSEFNASETEPVHLLQIWIFPETKGLTPGYEQKSIPPRDIQGRFRRIASRHGEGGSVTIHQDAAIDLASLGNGETVSYTTKSQRQVWLHVATGAVQVNNTLLEAGDGLGMTEAGEIHLQGVDAQSTVLLFDLKQ